jgi:hypothetical protein
MAKKELPDMSTYTSNRVFDGVRILTGEEAEKAKARIKRAFDKLKSSKKTS